MERPEKNATAHVTLQSVQGPVCNERFVVTQSHSSSRRPKATFYHATTLEAVLLIQKQGFRVGQGGVLEKGIYCTTALKQASTTAYLDVPLEAQSLS